MTRSGDVRLRRQPQLKAKRVLSFCVLLFCRSFVMFCFSQSKDKEPKTLCRKSVIRNLANTISKPNFRFNNNNWQLWQTTNNNNFNNNNYNIMTILEEQSYFNEAGNVSEETAYDSYYTQYTTPDSMDCGSDNLLVTFDYGYSDSIGAPPMPMPMPAATFAEDADAIEGGAIWFGTPPNDATAFKVHHVQHKRSLPEESLQSLISYDVDDFEELSEPVSESEEEQESEAEHEEVFYDSIES